MTLLDIRKQFVRISGRYDLVVDAADFEDNGANLYITEGQKSLERRLNYNPAVGKLFMDITAGTYKVQFQNCRAVQEVWALGYESRTELRKLDEYSLRAIHQKYVANMYTTPLASMQRGRPQFYYPTNLRRVPDDADTSSDSEVLSSYLDTISPTDPTYSGIIIFPPPDIDYALEIKGLFYNPVLVADADTNYWTINHPNLLVMSALRQLEMMYRGSKTASTWNSLIESELLNIEKDFIEQEISHIDTLEG